MSTMLVNGIVAVASCMLAIVVFATPSCLSRLRLKGQARSWRRTTATRRILATFTAHAAARSTVGRRRLSEQTGAQSASCA